MKALLRGWLDRAGYVVFRKRDAASYARDGLFTVHRHPFLSDANFRRAYARGVVASAGYDPGMEWRVHVALWAARLALSAKGDFVECGVSAGFVSSAIMESLNWGSLDRTFYLIDTFNGPVAEQFNEEESAKLVEIEKGVARGSYVTDLSPVIENFKEWPRVEFVQSEVPRVLPDSGACSATFGRCSQTAAWYRSTITPTTATMDRRWRSTRSRRRSPRRLARREVVKR